MCLIENIPKKEACLDFNYVRGIWCANELGRGKHLCIPNSTWCAFSYHDFLLQWKQPCVPFYDTTSLSVPTDKSGWWRCFENMFLRVKQFHQSQLPYSLGRNLFSSQMCQHVPTLLTWRSEMPVCTNFNDGGALREKLWCDDLFYTSDRMNCLDHFVIWSARLEDILIAGNKEDYFPYTKCMAFGIDSDANMKKQLVQKYPFSLR